MSWPLQPIRNSLDRGAFLSGYQAVLRRMMTSTIQQSDGLCDTPNRCCTFLTNVQFRSIQLKVKGKGKKLKRGAKPLLDCLNPGCFIQTQVGVALPPPRIFLFLEF